MMTELVLVERRRIGCTVDKLLFAECVWLET